MEVFNVTNVNQAFPLEINSIKAKGIPRDSRNAQFRFFESLNSPRARRSLDEKST
jgi:hypothetical protein